jgi:hypothetical protein
LERSRQEYQRKIDKSKSNSLLRTDSKSVVAREKNYYSAAAGFSSDSGSSSSDSHY